MDRRVSGFTLLAAVTLAACSPDLAAPLNPSSSLNFAKSVGESARHIAFVNGNEGAESFAARVAALGGSVTSFHGASGFAVVTGLTGSAASELASRGVDVQPDFDVSIGMPLAAAEADVSAVSDEANSQANPATASRYSWQWNMKLIGAQTAWAAGKLGSGGVTVAILDTGIDYDAPDLNGLIDLTRSKSFMTAFVGLPDNPATPVQDGSPIIPSDPAIIAATFPTRHQIADLHGHGTNVATQVSSKALVHAGVSSKTTLIGVKVLGANGYGSFSGIMNGVLWAADNGADVANMSLGGGFGRSHDGRTISTINRVFNYARQKDMVIVVSAGNSAIDLQHNGGAYSTYCDAPHVICVSAVGPRLGGATQNQDEPAYYTNFGVNSVDVAGPGGNADALNNFRVSAWPWGNDIASWVWSYCSKQRIAISRIGNTANGTYATTACAAGNRVTGSIGTSQAAPHVAGLAALLIAEGVTNPAAVKQAIQESADPIDPAYGRGRINVKAALGL